MLRHAQRVASLVIAMTAFACSNYPSIEGDDLGCGTPINTVGTSGIVVYSNGEKQGTGESCRDAQSSSEAMVYGPNYQCVELASRFFMRVFGMKAPFNVDANRLCDTAEHGSFARELSVRRHGTSSHPAYVPVFGDLMVFSRAPFGHVGVVTSVDGNFVTIYEENGALDGRATHVLGSQECFIHATVNDGNPHAP